jgi:flagellar secretion chaperone FliS
MTAAAANPANAYLRTKVLTASPEELRLMLLDGAIKFAHQGREGLANRNYEQSFTGISQCREIVLELLTSIKPEVDAELAARVRAVYTFMYTTLVEASMERKIEKLDKVLKLLGYERETWALLMQKLAEERGAGQGPGMPAADARPAPISVEA